MKDPAASFARNTRLFENCLEGMTDAEASFRPGERANSLAFLAAHILDARFFLAGMLGMGETHPFASLLADATGIDDVEALPPLDDLEKAWLELAPRIESRIAALTVEEFDAPSGQRFPLTGPTLAEGIAFLLHHEMYHIGQMALLRKLLGHEAMKWE